MSSRLALIAFGASVLTIGLMVTGIFQALPGNDEGGSFMKTLYRIDTADAESPAKRPKASASVQDRLAARLSSSSSYSVSPKLTANALQQRSALQARKVSVRFLAGTGSFVSAWNIDLSKTPQWMALHTTPWNVWWSVEQKAIEEAIASHPHGMPLPPLDAILISVKDKDGVLYAQTNGVAKDGYEFDHVALARQIKQAFEEGIPEVTITTALRPGRIVNATGYDVGPLTLLAKGRSDFAGSGEGRKDNVKKGLSQHLNNVLVPPGETFAFNSILGRVTEGNGWKLALAIFGGGALKPVPGGGICQVATTLYRAVMNAGFPVLERKSHSLFVSYYEKFGLGLDATIYPGSQDLVFTNDTADYILIQAFSEGMEATVNVYGQPDGRTVALHGPYLSASAPADVKVKGNEIAWQRTVTYGNGEQQQEVFRSRYKSIPWSVQKKATGSL